MRQKKKFNQPKIQTSAVGLATLVVDSKTLSLSQLIYKTVNSGFGKIAGLPGNSMIGKSVFVAHHESTLNEKAWIDFYKNILVAGFDEEKTHELLLNERKYMLQVFSPAENHIVVVVVSDVPRQRSESGKTKYELALRESEEHFKHIFEHIQDAFFVADLQGIIIDISPAIEIISKGLYIREELIGKSMARFAENTGDRQHFLDKLLKYQNVSDFRLSLINRDGSLIHVSVSAGLKMCDHDKTGKIYGSLRDITKRIVAEEKLQQTIQTYQDIFNTIDEALYIQDNNGVFIEVNEGAARLYGCERKDLIGLTPLDVAAPGMNNMEETQKKSMDVFATGESVRFDFWSKRMNGEFFLKDLIVNKGKYFDKDVLLATGRDITEIKKTEQKLREVIASKDKFFSIISHDLRSPFNSLLGLSSVLLELARDKEYDEMEKYAESIHNSANRAYELLINLLEWSQSQIGKMEYLPTLVDASQLIENEVDILSNQSAQKDVEIEIQMPDILLVFADKNMLSSIVRNLISNAIKFSHSGGRITVSGKMHKQKAVFGVHDKGIGMDSTTIEKLFHIDKSTSKPGTKNEQGTGLGLLLCKEFVEKNGGKIWVESSPGTGSSFYFELPVAAPTNFAG